MKSVPLKTRFLHELLAYTASQYPDHIAIEVPEGHLRPERYTVSYARFAAQTRAFSTRLSFVAGPGHIIAILLPRDSADLYCAQLAILQSGAAFVCVDPLFPDQQIRFILEDADVSALITNTSGKERCENAGILVPVTIDINVSAQQHQLQTEASCVHPEWLSGNSLAYLIYTSGTTGRPKGVMVAHESIHNLIIHDRGEFNLTPGDRVAQGSSSAYDSSLEEIWLAFASGATLVVLDDDSVRAGPDLVTWLKEECISVFCPPPTLLRSTGCEDPSRELPHLKLLYVGGEPLTPDVVERWAPGRRLVNGYGPTECTVTALRSDIAAAQPITIGKPVPGVRAHVLNESLELQPQGEAGELCLAGTGLAIGYRNQEQLTQQRFPIHAQLGRIYRTGDLVLENSTGNIEYLGRIDSQIKLRGYRIELEAIEMSLAQCEGVREAACSLQGEAGNQVIAAHIVPASVIAPPDLAGIKASLGSMLPVYMIPSVIACIDALPKTVSGKIKRNALPLICRDESSVGRPIVAPSSAEEEQIASAVSRLLGLSAPVSVRDDFFADLGGNSLQAAQLISILRQSDTALSGLTVRDVYECKTIASLVGRAINSASWAPNTAQGAEYTAHNNGGPTCIQLLWLLLELVIGTVLATTVAMHLVPTLLDRFNPVLLVFALPLLLFIAVTLWTPIAVLIAVAIKQLLIGRYKPVEAPVWKSLFIRNWIVTQVVKLVPWRVLSGTEYQIMALRALGSKIGSHVHIHRGVDLTRGGWDLLEIGDNVTISQDAMVHIVDLQGGNIVFGHVRLGDGVTLETRAGVSPNTNMEAGAYLCALASLNSGESIPPDEMWDGIPAVRVADAPLPPTLPYDRTRISPLAHGTALIGFEFLLVWILALPVELSAISIGLWLHIDLYDFSAVLRRGYTHPAIMIEIAAILCSTIPVAVALQALVVRLLGRVPAGCISRWSYEYIRVWIKSGLVDLASEWLSGSLMWPIWLRAAGMTLGSGCEISTIIDVVPELVTVGNESFFADGIYLGGPRIHRGTVTLAQVAVGKGSFLGNHVVVPCGETLPDEILVGVCTVARGDQIMPGTSWFGHPAFELPSRERLETDRSLTHSPSPVRYINRVVWEWMRFALPALPMLVILAWYQQIAYLQASNLPALNCWLQVMATTVGCLLFPCVCLIALKWILLGKVRPGVHVFWSCWCCRWDLLYVAWGLYAEGVLSALEGTEALNWFLRLMGMHIGKGVVLGPGFSHVVDPDMLYIEDGATVNAMFQAHTFEDRVLKIDYVYVRSGASVGCGTVPLYGADIGRRTVVDPHSVVMKHELLLPERYYTGAPTRERQHGGTSKPATSTFTFISS